MAHDRSPTRTQVNRMADILEAVYPRRYRTRGSARAEVVRCHEALEAEARAAALEWV